jgi:hypothetical protein
MWISGDSLIKSIDHTGFKAGQWQIVWHKFSLVVLKPADFNYMRVCTQKNN